VRVFEAGHSLRGEQGREGNDVVEGDSHAATGEGVAHVHGVAEQDEAGLLLGGRGQERVGHGAQLASVNGAAEGGLGAGGQVGEDDMEQVVLDAAGGKTGAGQALGNVDQGARLVRANLVEENRRGIGEDDMAVIGAGQVGIDELKAPEAAADTGRVGEEVAAKFGIVAVGDEGQGAKVAVGAAVGSGVDADDLAAVAALDGGGDSSLDDGDVGGGGGLGAQLGDEAAVVEGAALGGAGGGGRRGRGQHGVGHVNRLLVIQHLVAVAGDGVDVVEAVCDRQPSV